jgi:hypothetical protein
VDRRVFQQPAWWRYPGRALLIAPAVVMDAVLMPYYLIWFMTHDAD